MLFPCTILTPLLSETHPHYSLCLGDSTLTAVTLHGSKCQICLIVLQAELLVSALKGTTEGAKSKQSPSDCNNQIKGLNKGEKPYHALCEHVMHFGDLKSNSSALTKTFLERQGSNFFSFSDEGQTKEKYSGLAIYYMQNQSL